MDTASLVSAWNALLLQLCCVFTEPTAEVWRQIGLGWVLHRGLGNRAWGLAKPAKTVVKVAKNQRLSLPNNGGPGWVRTSDQGIMRPVDGVDSKGLTSSVSAPSSAQAPKPASAPSSIPVLADLVKALAALTPEERAALVQLLSPK